MARPRRALSWHGVCDQRPPTQAFEPDTSAAPLPGADLHASMVKECDDETAWDDKAARVPLAHPGPGPVRVAGPGARRTGPTGARLGGRPAHRRGRRGGAGPRQQQPGDRLDGGGAAATVQVQPGRCLAVATQPDDTGRGQPQPGPGDRRCRQQHRQRLRGRRGWRAAGRRGGQGRRGRQAALAGRDGRPLQHRLACRGRHRRPRVRTVAPDPARHRHGGGHRHGADEVQPGRCAPVDTHLRRRLRR